MRAVAKAIRKRRRERWAAGEGMCIAGPAAGHAPLTYPLGNATAKLRSIHQQTIKKKTQKKKKEKNVMKKSKKKENTQDGKSKKRIKKKKKNSRRTACRSGLKRCGREFSEVPGGTKTSGEKKNNELKKRRTPGPHVPRRGREMECLRAATNQEKSHGPRKESPAATISTKRRKKGGGQEAWNSSTKAPEPAIAPAAGGGTCHKRRKGPMGALMVVEGKVISGKIYREEEKKIGEKSGGAQRSSSGEERFNSVSNGAKKRLKEQARKRTADLKSFDTLLSKARGVSSGLGKGIPEAKPRRGEGGEGPKKQEGNALDSRSISD